MRSCDLHKRIPDWYLGSVAGDFLCFSSAHLGPASVTQTSAALRMAKLPCWAATRLTGTTSTGQLFSAHPRNAMKKPQPIARLTAQGKISAANYRPGVAMFHLQARHS
jgi:hypothetical protein